jgi:hypothetical protein
MARHPPAHSRVALRSLGGAGNAIVGGDDRPRGMPTVALHKETVSRTVPEWAAIGQRPRTPNHVGMVEGKLTKAHGEVKTEEVGRLVEQSPIIIRPVIRDGEALPSTTSTGSKSRPRADCPPRDGATRREPHYALDDALLRSGSCGTCRPGHAAGQFLTGWTMARPHPQG